MTSIHDEIIHANDIAFPYHFKLSEYDCVWAEGPIEDENITGGFISIRINHTGDDTLDWYESDIQAENTVQATEIARGLISEYEDISTVANFF